MSIEFYKYQGTGNDFVIINNFDAKFKPDASRIQKICHRKFGVGADGLMLLEKSNQADFKLIFFNPDGSESFCGNGSRCAVKFARETKLVNKDEMSFEAFDGLHTAVIHGELVSISMRNVDKVQKDENGTFINTGSPHVVVVKENLDELEIVEEGRRVRYDKHYAPVGTNVNFLQVTPNGIKIRTYEKGVENETLSCGTGVTASALVHAALSGKDKSVAVETLGGNLEVSFSRKGDAFESVVLTGPAVFVFKGWYE